MSSPSILARLVLALAVSAPLAACKSPAPDEPAAAPESAIPADLPTEPVARLDALLALPFSAHASDPEGVAAATRRIMDAIEGAARVSPDPARFVAVQAAGAVLMGNPTAGSYSAVKREWSSLRSRN